MLILCCTPLQTLIAKAMVEARGVSAFKLIYYTWIDNAKHRHYYDLLSRLAVDCVYIKLDSRFPEHFERFRQAFRDLKIQDEESIAFACIDNFYIQYAINRYRFATILTFDDGTANIVRESVYHKPMRRSWPRRVVERVLRGAVDQLWIRESVAAHYTIYPGFENIVDATRLVSVPLFKEVMGRSRRLNKESIRIFLGQPVSDFRDDGLLVQYTNLLNALSVDEYLPHPREYDLKDINNAKMTNLIAEQYIAEKLMEYAEVSVYSIGSTALLNVEHPRLKKIIITYKNAPHILNSMQPLFEKRGCYFMPAPNPVDELEVEL
ncbi:glycosyltransferase family 52 [Cupriavidus sp. CuC1]|uniref:glycosyltransferase family 52 n=1 Tax=Cupriavidus sp. CuC1 TaxID=3373131 RepID=UPI0037D1124F